MDRRRRRLAVVALVLLGLLLWLLLRSCGSRHDVPHARLLPREVGPYFHLRDAAAVIEHCRTNLRPASYAGVLRGAHGALWAGEGSALDRTLLAAEALAGIGIEARIIPSDPVRLAYRDGGWRVLRLDDAAEPEVAAVPPPGAKMPAELVADPTITVHRIVPAIVLAEGGAQRRIEAKTQERLAEWVYEPVTLTAEASASGPRYVLRVGSREVLATEGLDGARRAELELVWRHGESAVVWRRELFAQENSAPGVPGHAAPRVGDRYAIVVSAGPLVPEVLETRAAMLADTALTPLGDARLSDLVLLGVRYQVASDQNARELAVKSRVRVRQHEPRVTIAASTPVGGSVASASERREPLPIPGLSLDALTERVEAEGPRARSFHTARGLANDEIETKVVADAGGFPVISASAILSRYRSQDPVVPARRLEVLAAEIARLRADEPTGTCLRISALPPDLAPARAAAGAPALRLERTDTGLLLHGVEQGPGDPATGPTHRWAGPEARSALGTEVGPVALLVDRLLTERVARADFRLEVVREPAWAMDPLPLTDGSVLQYRIEHGGKAYGVTVLVSMAGGFPGGMWFTQPEGSAWVYLDTPDGSRVGAIGHLWPEVVSSSAIGPILESYVVPAREAAAGEAVEMEVRVGAVAQRVKGVRVALGDEPGPFLQVESGGRWSAAFPVRDDAGFPRRKDDERRVHVLGAGPAAELSVPWKRCVRLRPIEVEVEGRWRWAHLVETAAGRTGVRLLDEAGAGVLWVPAEKTRALEPVEARRGEAWEPAGLVESRAAERRVRFREGAAEDDTWRPAGDVRTARGAQAASARATVVPGRTFSLLIAWERGTTRVTLEMVSPVVHGRVVDAETGVPLAGAILSRSQWSARSAADGSFALHLDDPLFPQAAFVGGRLAEQYVHPAIRKSRRRDLLLLVDSSEASLRGQAPDGPPGQPPGQRRFDGIVTAVTDLLAKLASPQDDVRVHVFTHGRPTGGASEGKPDAEIRLQGGDLRPREVVERLRGLEPSGPSRPVEALAPFLAELAGRRRGDDAVVLWLTSGGGLDDAGAVAQAYARAGVAVPLHVFGFGVAEGSVADQALQALAKASGGSYRASDPAPPHKVGIKSYRARYLDLGVRVAAPCYITERLVLPVGDPGIAPRQVVLAPDCCCRGSPARLLTITRDTRAKLAEAKGLSPRAAQWIEDRVAGGAWEVRIPARRTNVGRVTAFAWFEVETKTGRLVGRTEDGLHGSLADPETWPELNPDDLDPSQWNPHASSVFQAAASQQPFVMWFEGVTAYTMGSVQGAFDWRNSPGFRSADPEEFKRFVQAHALDHAAEWWADVASQAGGQFADNFWSGVCLNFVLQSAALGLRSDGCARRWAEDLCNRGRKALEKAGEELTTDGASDLLESELGEEYAELLQMVLEQGFSDLAEELKDQWKNGVKLGIPCERLRGAPRPK